MNPVDTATPSLASPVSTASEIAGSPRSNPTSSAAESLLPVTKELAAMQGAVPTVSAATSSTTTLQKVLEVLVSSVQALVGLITALVAGGKMPTVGRAQEATPSTPATRGASPNSGATTSGDTSSAAAGQSSNTSSMSSGSSMPLSHNRVSEGGRSSFDVIRNDIGQIAVRTLDGFMIRAEGKDEAWTITGPDGKTTRIWGDPHVKESDGKRWDFLNRSTFQFGKNKATVEVVPAGNGTTLSSRITIYSGSDRVTIDGIDKNRPNVVAVSSDGRQHDDGLADGITYKRSVTNAGEAWTSNLTGKVM